MTESEIHKTISVTVDQGVAPVDPEKLSETEVESSEIPTRGGTDEKSSPGDPETESTAEEEEFCKRNFGFLPIPKNCRVSPTKPFKFNLAINLLFGFASTFTVANLYYNQPILIHLSDTFDVPYDRISNVPSLTQAGYAGALLLISPLGDLAKRRPLILLLCVFGALISIGLASAQNLVAFEALSFISGFVSVTPQILLPLTADLAPREKRAQCTSIVLAGLIFGLLVARVLAGTISNFVSWRYVYWMAVGLQFFIFILLYFTLPDFPPKQKNLKYHQILWTMGKFMLTEPVLVQACLNGMLTSAVFASFWTTLTFLLGDDPYDYSSLVIGLFGLIGMLGVCTAPLIGRYVDRLVPWTGVLIGMCIQGTGQVIVTAAGLNNVAAVIIPVFLLDVGQQMQQVSNQMRVFAISDLARARLNACYIIFLFIGISHHLGRADRVGQVIGSKAGTQVYTLGGYTATGALSCGWIGFNILVLFARGPHTKKWVGWAGGTKLRKVKSNHQEQASV